MSEQEPNRWQVHAKTVSEPAEHAKKEGLRRITFGPASAEYDIAPLPDGRIAIQLTCALESDCSMKIPWRAFPTRDEAIGFFPRETTAFFKRAGTLQKEQEAARRKIMAILEPTSLWGFEEPEPGTGPVAEPTPDPTEPD